jgi:hypothetical protein
MINKQKKRETTTLNYKSTVNDKVGLIVPKKTRNNVKTYYDTITDISGKSITIFAADDSVKTFYRFRFIPVDTTTKIKEIKSIECNVPRGSYREILKYYFQRNSYKVKFDIQDENNSYIETIKKKEQRTKNPLEFFQNRR